MQRLWRRPAHLHGKGDAQTTEHEEGRRSDGWDRHRFEADGIARRSQGRPCRGRLGHRFGTMSATETSESEAIHRLGLDSVRKLPSYLAAKTQGWLAHVRILF